ncbi:MAG: DUF2971 domain-containing protein [Candidatus Marinimicrobia bacterium]|nr:DUF2971 domain-containing protein [Candidatus Neomarinimicrobiota bacterium]
MEKSIEHIYRFRSIDRLLGKSQELALQEIFLANSTELNDPMEGYQDVFWKGDEILWENLLRHYLIVLLWNTTGCLIMDDKSFDDLPIPVTLTEEDLPTDELRTTYQHIVDRFFSSPGFDELPNMLASLPTPLRLESLRLILTLIHRTALHSVMSELKSEGLLSGSQIIPSFMDQSLELRKIFESLKQLPNEEKQIDIESLSFVINSVRDHVSFLNLFQSFNGSQSGRERKINYLFIEFPDRYTESIASSLIYPKWYTACFSANCTNASMWSTYGDNHRGAALLFRVHPGKSGKPELLITGVNSVSSSGKGMPTKVNYGRLHGTLYQVQYSDKAPSIDFFRFLGQLPKNKIINAWHSNRRGDHSPLTQDIFKNIDSWREELWSLFVKITTTKLKDWIHEDEYRLVMTDMLGLIEEHRKIRYEFSQLMGIVFGMRTSLSDKYKINKVIEEKCRDINRDDFKLYQMRYDAKKRCLTQVPL